MTLTDMKVKYNSLSLPDILAALPGDHPWRQSITCFEIIDSTNTQAKRLAAQGAPHGTVLIANSQTGGRGRLGRGFHSPEGVGIYLSVILRPNCPLADIMHLTCAAAVAVCDAVAAQTGLRPGIKWTNDLVLDQRKLAGILTELSVEPATGHVQYAVVGIGINCCQALEDFPEDIRPIATSLSCALGKTVHRSRLAAAMIGSLHKMSLGLQSEKDKIMASYRTDCVTLGKDISIVAPGSVRHAKAMDIDDNGALLVRWEDGTVSPVSSGEVSIRGMYGYV